MEWNPSVSVCPEGIRRGKSRTAESPALLPVLRRAHGGVADDRAANWGRRDTCPTSPASDGKANLVNPVKQCVTYGTGVKEANQELPLDRIPSVPRIVVATGFTPGVFQGVSRGKPGRHRLALLWGRNRLVCRRGLSVAFSFKRANRQWQRLCRRRNDFANRGKGKFFLPSNYIHI